MTKTLSLPLCRKLSEMGIEVEAEKNWNVYPEVPVVQEKGNFGGSAKDMTPYLFKAYQLDELPAVLRAIGEKKGWKDIRGNEFTPGGVRVPVFYKSLSDVIEEHFLRICELYAKSGSLGEGSEAERYLIDLIK